MSMRVSRAQICTMRSHHRRRVLSSSSEPSVMHIRGGYTKRQEPKHAIANHRPIAVRCTAFVGGHTGKVGTAENPLPSDATAAAACICGGALTRRARDYVDTAACRDTGMQNPAAPLTQAA